MTVIKLNDDTFESTITGASPILVMFYADWAGPCNLVRPVFEKVAQALGNQITFCDFNLDDNPRSPQKYYVRSVPYFIMYVDGTPAKVKTGALTEEILREMCDEFI